MSESRTIPAGAARSAFSDTSQHNRLMRLDFPFQDGPPAILLPNKLAAHEEVSRGFRFDVEVLSDDARIPLKLLMGRMVTISLVREGGSGRSSRLKKIAAEKRRRMKSRRPLRIG